MVIVVSGTHASGKTSLIDAFVSEHPQFDVLPDPVEVLGEYGTDAGAGVFFQQLEVAAARLLGPLETPVIVERGPLDFLAYLQALDMLGRRMPSQDLFARGVPLCVDAMRRVGLIVLLPLDAESPITVPLDEDPELRTTMDEVLVELAGDTDLTGGAQVVELTGTLETRLAVLNRLTRTAG